MTSARLTRKFRTLQLQRPSVLKVEATEEEMRREAWVDIGSEVSHEAGCRLRMM